MKQAVALICTMRIRRAVSSDFPVTATFSVPAFANDELYQFTNPFISQYPEDFRQHFLQRHRQRNVLPGHIYWVAVVDSSEGVDEHGIKQEAALTDCGQTPYRDEDKVVGFALWRRHGASKEARKWQTQTWAECTNLDLYV